MIYQNKILYNYDDINIEGFSSNSTISENLVNGKPVYYLKNQIGVSVPSDAGAVWFWYLCLRSKQYA